MKPSSKLYGITHSPDGAPRVVEPKTVKVGIGLARGKAVHAYIDLDGKWVVQADTRQEILRQRLDTKSAAQMKYREFKKIAVDRKYPSRLPYFTFSHVAGSGDMEPAWDVIETHGPLPTEIDIIFIREDSFLASYQLWTATEKKCDGDGKCALRVNAMAVTPEEKELAAQSESCGDKYFTVTRCWLAGCQYSKPSADRPAPCHPVGRLFFQLLNSPRLGGTAVFNTTGYKSISQIFSSIEIFKRATGRGDPEAGFVAGIPLKMVLRPYRVTHDGRINIQYAVSLEFRAENALALKRSIMELGMQYRLAGTEPMKQLEEISGTRTGESSGPLPEENPAAIAAEFLTDGSSSLVPGGPEEDSDEAAYLGPGGVLEHAWQDAEAAAMNPAKSADPRAASDDVRKFYELCRQKGMTDAAIIDHLGSIGFEKYEEITAKALPGLVTWAQSCKPTGQGKLL